MVYTTEIPIQNKYFHGSGASTTLLKSGPGTLESVIIASATAKSTLTLYDGLSVPPSAISPTTISAITISSGADPVCLTYNLCFYTGLFIVATGTFDLTVVYK